MRFVYLGKAEEKSIDLLAKNAACTTYAHIYTLRLQIGYMHVGLFFVRLTTTTRRGILIVESHMSSNNVFFNYYLLVVIIIVHRVVD